MKPVVEIEESLYDVLKETDLLGFRRKLVFEKQLTRLDHFNDVTDDELMSYGLSTPAVRRLRNAIEKRARQSKKGKLFGNKREKFVAILADNTTLVSNSAIDNDLNSLNPSFIAGTSTSPCLIARDEIKLLEKIGEGTFAVVKHAIWNRNGRKLNCAVKILCDMTEQVKADLFSEISSMQKFNHPNLIRLYGVVFGDPTLMVIEFCENGALLFRLRNTTKEKLLVTRLLVFAQQIANGMSYLESRRFVHRDLAARNVLLSDNEEVVKICDFGLTRPLNENERLYVMSGQKKVPFSWCPPESLRFRQFSHKSDVWAFGVTLWELYTYGEEPWIGYKAVDVLKAAEAGECLRKTDYCPKEIYDIMQMCWNLSAENRPKFSHLRTLLQDIKFTIAICRTARLAADAVDLNLQVNDRVILVSERDNDNWFGQNIASQKFGVFPRSIVTICSNRASISAPVNKLNNGMSGSPASINNNHSSVLMDSENFLSNNVNHRREISFPIQGSFIHAGHGDINENKSWGYVEKIDDIYLKNPILGNPLTNVAKTLDSMTVAEMANGSHTQVSDNGMSFDQFGPKNGIVIDDSAIFMSLPRAVPSFSEFSNLNSSSFKNFNDKPTDVILMPHDKKSDSFLSFTNVCERKEKNKSFSFLPVFSEKNANRRAEANSSLLLSAVPMKTSKYDSAISIPRPFSNNPSSVLCNSPLKITLPPQSKVNLNNESKLGINTLPLAKHTNQQTAAHSLNTQEINLLDFMNLTSANVAHLPIKAKKDENDPFVVTEDVMSLARKKRYNEILYSQIIKDRNAENCSEKFSQSNSFFNSQSLTNRPSSSNSLSPPLTKNSNVQFGNANSLVTKEVNSCIQQNIPLSSLQTTTSLSETPTTKTSIVSASFLPPPSKLLLSGYNGRSVCSNSSNSSEMSNNLSTSWSVDNSASQQQNNLKNDPQISDLLNRNNIGELSLSGSNFFVDSKSLHYKPIFAIEGSVNNGSSLNEELRPRLRYGANGIPILEPTPATISYRNIKSSTTLPSQFVGQPKSTANMPPIIDLNDLNTDAMVDKVKHLVDFANIDQCRATLRRNCFDVEKAVRDLKIGKLLEMGLAGDKNLAASALESCQWNVNEAVNRLVS